MSCGPSAKAAGQGDSCVCVPVPVSVTVTSSALEPTVIVAVLAPDAVGSKRARRPHVSSAVSVVVVVQSAGRAGQPLKLAASLPPSVIAVSVTGTNRCS